MQLLLTRHGVIVARFAVVVIDLDRSVIIHQSTCNVYDNNFTAPPLAS